MEDLFQSLLRVSLAVPRFGVNLLSNPGEAQKHLLHDTLRILQDSTDAMRLFTPGTRNRVALQELKNKLEAFEHFRYAHSLLGLAGRPEVSLADRVHRVSRWDAHRGLWMIEGLGYAYAEIAGDDAEAGPGLLRDPAVGELPPASLLPLHTGMGLWLARRTLVDDAGRRSARTLGAGLQRFLERCRHHARPGYADAVFEALGLIARNLRPADVPEIDRELHALDPARLGTFWHGVGRGLFFAPTQSLPGAAALWVAVERVRREASHEIGRSNALAGLAWAMTLVHLRHPEIVDGFLGDYGNRLDRSEEFAYRNGVSSAIALWYDAAGNESYLEAVRNYRPASAPAECWRRLVTDPIDDALERRDLLVHDSELGALFSCPVAAA